MSKVLVIDDEPQIRRALRTSLEAHGYEVVTVGTGQEGVVGAADLSPDLVLLDLGLPDMDGTEVIRRIRAFSEVPVIILSVRETQLDKVKALDAGADDFVTKPFAMEELLARARAGGPYVRQAPGRSGAPPDPLRRGAGAPHAHRVRATRGIRYESGEAPDPSVAPAAGVGSGLWNRDLLPADLRPHTEEEAR